MKALLILLLLTGCAQDRYLSAQEDAQMKADCEPVGGCVYMPSQIWQRIQAILNQRRGTAI